MAGHCRRDTAGRSESRIKYGGLCHEHAASCLDVAKERPIELDTGVPPIRVASATLDSPPVTSAHGAQK